MSRIVIDTGTFFYPGALLALRNTAVPVVVPAGVVAERVRQLAKKGIPREHLLGLLQRLDFHVEHMGILQALRYSRHIHDDGTWKRLARDAFIAGHVRRGDELWTTNAKDFVQIGVPEPQVVDVVSRFGPESDAADSS